MKLPTIVFVHLGKRPPNYLISNLVDTKRRFPQVQIKLIGDNYAAERAASRLNIDFFMTKNWQSDLQNIWKMTGHPLNFREGFWIKTIARFFALNHLQEEVNEPLIHVESDVWLSDNFPFHKFQNIGSKIGFSLETLTQGSACILWIPNHEISRSLVEVSLNVLKQEPHHTDMTILGAIVKENLMPHYILPTISPNSLEGDERERILASENFKEFDGAFDALPYGMFILGSDPRNGRGISKMFKERPHQIIPSVIMGFEVDPNSSRVFVKTTIDKFELFNLHNHSKNIGIWSEGVYKVIMRNSNLYAKKAREFDRLYFLVFVSSVFRYLQRKIGAFLRNWELRK